MEQRPGEPTRQIQPPVQYPEPVQIAGQVMDRGAERMLSAAAHGAIAFGFMGISFLISLAISGVIWLYGTRSPQVRFHSEQAGCYQCAVLLINIAWVVALGVGGGFSLFSWVQGKGDFGVSSGVGWGLVLFGIWFVLSILYGIYAAVRVLLGKPFKYPIIGDRFL